MNKKISLTGIKPTGIPHLGNYLGAIRPALKLSEEYQARYFIADYHALNSIKSKEILKENTYAVAATWLASGLDPQKDLIYRQSDVPQIFELTSMLMAFTPKGLMNRAHSYKASVANNKEANKDDDAGINMGLFTYPVLMAADILLFDTDVVPVGKDQIQHIEMTVDIAEVFNKNYKKNLLTIPKAIIDKDENVIPGLDGRKMSKSYNNTIPLFEKEKKLRKTIMKIKTNSQGIEDSKDPDNCNIFSLYKYFANQDELASLSEKYQKGGMGWGEAKEILFQKINSHLLPIREKYHELMENKEEIEKVLIEGGEKARKIAKEKIKILKEEVGL